MRDFVEHHVLEERIERHARCLVVHDQLLRERHEDAIELRAHGVLQLEAPGAFPELHRFIVRQVDRDGLGALVRLAGHIHHVVRVQVGVGARRLALVRRIHRDTRLECRQLTRVLRQPLAPCLVLHEHERLVRRLVAEQLVLVCLYWTEHEIERVALHVHPRQVAGLVAIRGQRRREQREVATQPCILGQRGGLPHAGRRALIGPRKKSGVGNRHERTRRVAPDHRVKRLQAVRMPPPGRHRSLEFLPRHVARIEVRTVRLAARTGNEWHVVVEPVPRADVHVREQRRHRITDRGHQGIARADDLGPVDAVHFARSVDEERQHLPLLPREHRGVRLEAYRRVAAEPLRRRRECRCDPRRHGRRRGDLRRRRGRAPTGVPAWCRPVSQQPRSSGRGADDGRHVREVHTGRVVGELVIVAVQVERGQRVRRNADVREGDVVAPRKEPLLRSRITHDRQARGGEHPAHGRALKAGEPCLPLTAGERIRAADHLDLEVGGHPRQRHHRVQHVPPRAE